MRGYDLVCRKIILKLVVGPRRYTVLAGTEEIPDQNDDQDQDDIKAEPSELLFFHLFSYVFPYPSSSTQPI